MLVHRRIIPPAFAGTHLYNSTYMERCTVRVNCLSQKHHTMSLVSLKASFHFSKLYSKRATKTNMYMHVHVYVVTVLFSCLNPGPRQCVQCTCRIRLFSHWFIKNDQSQSLRLTIWSCHLQESHKKVKAGQEV